jgi:hypothetical protein
MSTFDDASLVFIPSGYKDQKLYSVKPLSGDGDLTFSRASSATRVASNGLIEKVRTNLLLQSEALSDSGVWLPYSGTTVTANAATAPDGTLTAEQIFGTAGFRGVRQVITSNAVPHTFSVYLRSATGSSALARIWIDSTNITVTVTTAWQRFVITATTLSSEVRISGPATGSGDIDFYAWGAQLETGDIATDYIATTTTAVSVGPVSGLPRLDYLNSSCPSLILEPQRSNLALWSENFDNAGWGKFQSSVTANAGTSPDGYTNADKLIPSIVLDVHQASQVVTLADNTSYAFSCFAKADGYNFLRLAPTTKAGTTNSTFFNLSTGAVGTVGGGHTASIENYGNGWYRCTIVYNSGSGASTTTQRVAVSQSDNQTSFAGSGTDGILIYGAQIEAGSYVSSYLNTLSTSVTRVADAASKTGISSLIGQTEGTIFVEFNSSNVADNSNAIFGISNGTTSSRALIYLTSNRIDGQLRDAGVTQALFASVTMTANTTYKCAIAYKANDVAFYINGTQIGTDTVATVPAMSDVRFDSGGGAVPCNFPISQALVFKTRLTNAQLAELTA